MDEVDLPPPEFAPFLVAQSAVQIQHECGIHVLARSTADLLATKDSFIVLAAALEPLEEANRQ